MGYHLQVFPKELHFKKPAGTSRGTYTLRRSWFIRLFSDENPGREGVGECAPLPSLSYDDIPDYEDILKEICRKTEEIGTVDVEELRKYPSILFGWETARAHFLCGSRALLDTPFSRGKEGIPINGLIWMGSYADMYDQIKDKIENGFRCIKLKIGAIDFEEEISLLRYIRNHFTAKEIELRVDANGAFIPTEAMDKLKRLSELELHSIEQPIRAGQWEEMARLCEKSPLPIALDEELIGCITRIEKQKLLSDIRPHYIVLKPSLHGGMTGGDEWIEEAEKQQIGWWVTSALESNIGLNAIAQWCATKPLRLPQGLGTGALFSDNFDAPLELRGDKLWYVPDKKIKPIQWK